MAIQAINPLKHRCITLRRRLNIFLSLRLKKIGHSLKSCLVPHFKNKCLFIQEYQIPIIANHYILLSCSISLHHLLNRPFKKGQLIMKRINSQINQAIKLRCLKIVQTLLSNQDKRKIA